MHMLVLIIHLRALSWVLTALESVMSMVNNCWTSVLAISSFFRTHGFGTSYSIKDLVKNGAVLN